MPRMTIDQLQIFLAVAQHMHFTRAAEELYQKNWVKNLALIGRLYINHVNRRK